jgi:hypothetical protein
LEVEAVDTSQHADGGKRMYAPNNDKRVGSVAKSSTSVGMGVHSGGRGDTIGEGVRGREDKEAEEVAIGGSGGARAGMVNARLRRTEARWGFGASRCSQAIMADSWRVAGVDVDAAEVEDRMGRAGAEGKEAGSGGARVMKPLACEA